MKPIRKAIFPVAGLGTRFLPATKAMPKEMLTVVDRPLIQHVVDEAREAGIEHFIFVTGRNKGVIEDHFDRQFELEVTLKERNKTADLKLLAGDQPEAGTVSFTRQQSPLGLGHAVWCARELVGHEPFALLLPDVLVQNKPGCLKQMIDAYNSAEKNANIIAVEEVPMERISAYGVVGVGKTKGNTFTITDMVEKPPRETGAVEPHHHRPLHPAAGDFRSAGEAGRRRRRRNPDHRFDDHAVEVAAVLRREVRRQELRLRLQDRLPRRQRRLRDGAARPRPGVARGDQGHARRLKRMRNPPFRLLRIADWMDEHSVLAWWQK